MKRILWIAFVMIVCWILYSCFYGNEDSDIVRIRWVKSYPAETETDVITGLKWTMSYLGARLPKGSMEEGIAFISDDIIEVNSARLGFDEQAIVELRHIFDRIKKSREYQLFGAVDVGRFVVLLINSPNHYYAITGASPTFAGFKKRFQFDSRDAVILNSAIASGNRIIQLSISPELMNTAFIGIEGEGDIEKGTFLPIEYEAMDFMDNGQLRFALYDSLGRLKTAASADLTNAGKPSKCLWCHELGVLPPFDDNHQLEGSYSTEEFEVRLAEVTNLLLDYRNRLDSDLDYDLKQEHTKMELLYLSFMEPSIERLAQEWGRSVDEIKQLLMKYKTHPHKEFSFLGDLLYDRTEVDILAPYDQLPIPTDPREHSIQEPNFLSGL